MAAQNMSGWSRPQLWAWLAIAAAIAFLVWLLAPILTPFLFGAILAYILDPIVERLTNRYFPRTLAVVLVLLIVFALFVALLLVVLPLRYKETRLLMEKAPAFLDWTDQPAAPWLKHKSDLDPQFAIRTLRQMESDAYS